MDIFAHGLWTNAVYEVAGRARGRKRSHTEVWLPILFGIAPDLISFGPLTIWSVLSGGFMFRGPHGAGPIPQYVHVFYSYTHSFVIFAAVFLALWIIRRKPYWLLGGWGIHIGIDIFSHTEQFFPTPFLFPVSSFRVSGISWADPMFMKINYALLALVYLVLYLLKRKNIRKN